MSGPTIFEIIYEVSAEAVQAAATARRNQAHRAMDVEMARATRLANEFADRAPEASRLLLAIERPSLAQTGGDQLAEAARAGAALSKLRSQISAAEHLAILEEIRLLQRAQATQDQLAQAGRAGATAVAGARDVTRTEVELGVETVPVVLAVGPIPVPTAEERLARVSEIVARGGGAVGVDVSSSLLRRAIEVDELFGWVSLLDVARQSVDRALDERDRRLAEQANAALLIGRLIGLDGDDVEHVRAVLEDCANVGTALPAGIADQVDVAYCAAVRRRLLAQLAASGCQPLDDGGGAAVGYVDHGNGTASRVQVDDRGLIVAPVASRKLDRAETAALEANNCALVAKLDQEAHRYDLHLPVVRNPGAGTTPIRIDELAGLGPAPAAAPTSTRDLRHPPRSRVLFDDADDADDADDLQDQAIQD